MAYALIPHDERNDMPTITPGNEITVRTNNQPRDIIDAWDLSPAEREEFEYMDWDALEAGTDSASFFRFKGQVYDLGEFTVAPASLPGWDGYQSDSYFSGMLVRYVDERVPIPRSLGYK